MKLTELNPAYVAATVLRDATNPTFVKYRLSEIGYNMDTDLLRLADKAVPCDAIVGKDPLTGLWVCLALGGRLAWSPGYKTIKAAVKNAFYA